MIKLIIYDGELEPRTIVARFFASYVCDNGLEIHYSDEKYGFHKEIIDKGTGIDILNYEN